MFRALLVGGLILIVTLPVVLTVGASEALSAPNAQAPFLFSDNFPCGTPLMAPNWFGKGGASTPFSGTVATDPQNPGNCVLTFNALTAAGDTFSKLITAPTPRLYLLEFDYLGIPGLGGVANDLGGTIGISNGFPTGHRWLAGTSTTGGIEQDLLVDDGQWRRYSVLFDPFQTTGCCGYVGMASFHLMLEDFSGAGGVAQDVFFDNIVVRVPPRTTFGLWCEGPGPMAGTASGTYLGQAFSISCDESQRAPTGSLFRGSGPWTVTLDMTSPSGSTSCTFSGFGTRTGMRMCRLGQNALNFKIT